VILAGLLLQEFPKRPAKSFDLFGFLTVAAGLGCILYVLSILISSATSIALFGGVFLLPLFLQNLQGYTAMQTGMLMFPGAIATGITMPLGGKHL